MHLCYIDESGTPEVPGNTSHYILAGLSIPIEKWSYCEKTINRIKYKYGLDKAEIHTGWILRYYIEQSKIQDFEKMNPGKKRYEVEKYRKMELLRIQKTGKSKLYHKTKKNFNQTVDYIHLTYAERKQFIIDIASTVGRWSFARLFAECIDKIYFDPAKSPLPTDEQAFEQLVTRFEKFLKIRETAAEGDHKEFGIMIHDNNQTVAKRHTEMMKHFHNQGTFWTKIKHIIETPLFVDSQLTSMVQIADCFGPNYPSTK